MGIKLNFEMFVRMLTVNFDLKLNFDVGIWLQFCSIYINNKWKCYINIRWQDDVKMTWCNVVTMLHFGWNGIAVMLHFCLQFHHIHNNVEFMLWNSLTFWSKWQSSDVGLNNNNMMYPHLLILPYCMQLTQSKPQVTKYLVI